LGIQGPWEDRVVAYDRFCELAVSSRKLLRFDDQQSGMLGLIDPAAGVRFLTERPLAETADLQGEEDCVH
jgi:hypothetical protein